MDVNQEDISWIVVLNALSYRMTIRAIGTINASEFFQNHFGIFGLCGDDGLRVDA